MADPRLLRFIAFYLPQYHPIPENDEWWGTGFTEWVNVAQARPLFKDHYQPHVPADMGFYDLRVAETRVQQAQLAKSFGIEAFCYYHYWFEGRRLLQRPFEEVLRSGEPDFPFCLCWANENWTRRWDGSAKSMLLPQSYGPDDDRRHMQWLAGAFADPRYVRIDGRPVFLVYRVSDLPDPARTVDVWKSEAQRLGVGEPYLCAVHSFELDRRDPADFGFDAAVQFAPDFVNIGPGMKPLKRKFMRVFRPRNPHRKNKIRDYVEHSRKLLDAPTPPYKRYPCVTPGWDNSARRRTGAAVILRGSTPEAYERWLREAVERFVPYSPEENLFFVNAWNEWAEGNHLEPDRRWGMAYLDAHARLLGTDGYPDETTG